ncbi:MAG TPA: hypothetical protein VNO50_10930 [Pyrinomonadaceae bacterium]|nr:hypothetical protein [Pyrinomonadaceae bacterium]
MKTFALLLTCILCAFALPARAAQVPFSSGTTAISTNVAYAAVPALGVGSVRKILAKSDSSAGTITFYNPTGPAAVVTNALAVGYSNILCKLEGTTWSEFDVLLIRSVANNTYQRVLLSSTNGSGILITNALTAATTSFALAPGDQVYKMASAGSYLVGATLVNWDGEPIWHTQSEKPGLIQISATGSTTNNVITVTGYCEFK